MKNFDRQLMGDVYFTAEVLDGLQSENKELKREHKKFRDIVEHAGQHSVFSVCIYVLNCVACRLLFTSSSKSSMCFLPSWV